MLVKKIILILLLFSVTKNYCQDSIKPKRHPLFIEVGISENVPFKTNYNKTEGSKNNSFYSSFQIYNHITVGYFSSVGYQFKLKNNLQIIPSLSYYFIQQQQEKIGESQCPGCFIYVQPFKGTIINETKSHLLAFSTAISYQIKKTRIESGIGVTDFLVQNFKTYYYSSTTNSETSDRYMNNHTPINIKFYSQHKVGYELLKNRLDLFLGAYIFFNHSKSFTPAINPTLSFRVKL